MPGNIEQAGLVAAVEQAAERHRHHRHQRENPVRQSRVHRDDGIYQRGSCGQYPSILKSGRQSAAFYEELWNTIRSGGSGTAR